MSGRARLILASPHAPEREMFADWLVQDGFEPVKAATPAAAIDAMRRPFDLLIADAGFAFQQGLHTAARGRARNNQTPPIVIGDAGDRAAEADADRRGAMYVSRPVEQSALVCSVSMLMMEARPTRRSVRKPITRLQASVDGVQAYIIDVSQEGLRLEIPRERRWAPPPFYSVRVPILDVGLMVQRMWAGGPSGPAANVSWCGGALARNTPRAEKAWRTFVDAVGGASPATTISQVV